MLKNLIKNISNLPGWRTDRKIVVIESDDWGSIRMASNESYKQLLSEGLTIDKGVGDRYNKYDTLASSQDLTFLFETLNSVKDSNNNSAKITAVSLTANPDFEKIRSSGFTEYFYEPFTTTLEKYNMKDSFALWKQGIAANIFVPEFHGREHLNIQPWLRALLSGDKEAVLAFNQGVWGYNRKSGMGFQAAFDLEHYSDLKKQKEIVSDGLRLFKEIHGYSAKFFVPPNGPINNELEKIAADGGIKFMSSPKIQKEVVGAGKTKTHFRYLGKRNSYKQIYITRNAFFEPSGSSEKEIHNCLAEIDMAFKFKKPAIISSHRVNYVGGLSKVNRDTSLRQLQQLLILIVKKWPSVEFMTSSELGDILKDQK